MMMCLSLHSYSQDCNDIKASITTWYKNKPAAVSLSFDDASYTQYLYAYPVLEKHDIKATFSIVGEWVGEQPAYTAETGYFEIKRMGWVQLRELVEHRHELAAHGYYHQKYDKQMAVPDLAAEMKKIKILIETRTGSSVHTLNYPYSYASGNIPEAAREAGYLFGRTGLDTINPPSPPNMFLLATNAVLNSEQPDSTELGNWLAQTKGNWLILMYHHLFPPESKEMGLLRLHEVEYSYSLSPEEFEIQIKALAATGYWIAPISEVGKYIAQRDNTEIRVTAFKKKIFIHTVTNLDKNLYDRPLTLKIELPWKKVKVEGSLYDGIFQTHGNILCIDVLPETDLILTKD